MHEAIVCGRTILGQVAWFVVLLLWLSFIQAVTIIKSKPSTPAQQALGITPHPPYPLAVRAVCMMGVIFLATASMQYVTLNEAWFVHMWHDKTMPLGCKIFLSIEAVSCALVVLGYVVFILRLNKRQWDASFPPLSDRPPTRRTA